MSDDVLGRYAAATAKTMMSLEEAAQLSVILAQRLRAYLAAQDLPEPLAVVGVAAGGLMVAKIVALELGLPLEILSVRRKASRVKRRLGKLPFVIPLVVAMMRMALLRRWLVPMIDRMNQLETKTGRMTVVVPAGPVILIDDCLESGNSILFAKTRLRQDGREVLVTGVLARSAKPIPDHRMKELQPLVGLLDRLHHFPWSQNNPEYPDFLAWLKRHGIEPW